MECSDAILCLDGRNLEIISGPHDQYLLINLKTHDYLKVTKRGYDLLSKSRGLSVDRAVGALADEGNLTVAQLHAFFDKIVRLGFVDVEPAGRDPVPPDRVQEVWLHVTDRCNLACPMCYFQADKTPPGDRCLTTGEVRRVIEIISKTRPRQVIISGGEPLLRHDLPELLDALKEHGQRVWLLTNGTLLTPAVCRWLLRRVDHISVSLDGTTAAVHERMRGQGTFDAVLRGIRALQEEGFSQVGIIPTIRRDNLSEIFDLDRFARSLHVSVDSRCLFTARGSAAACRSDYEVRVEELIQASMAEMQRRLSQPGAYPGALLSAGTIIDFAEPQVQHCGAGCQKISIDVDGNLYPCQLLHDGRFHLGNVLEFQDLNQLVCSARAQQVARFTANRIDNVAECRSCDIRHFCGGGCVVSNVADGVPLDRCPSYCPAIQQSYRVAVWEWRNNCSSAENLARVMEKLGRPEPTPPV